ncbi:B3 domain-containing protein At5g42700 isoform X2 [Quercus robur]|uniref:B3 domain-containing protein At5g42700 isoform X2 n=1 Tax=Quercus robur TaxID=38942 RepID=UPI0021623071|nr:B3 domain-containing protein At5g42700 isoform X2 [Quercus robur]
MVAAKQSYEDSRRKRVEENKKRMEALNLPLLSQALKTSPKPSPTKQAKPRVVQKQLVVVRRSTRFANKPAPIYKEVAVDRVAIPRRIFGRKRNLSNLVLASSEAVAEAEEKAGKLVWGLPPGCPIFTKSMQPYHVAGGVWLVRELGLPSNFSERNLPSHDAVMTLIDEDGDGYPTKYLAKKSGLSGGWKGFAVAHHLAYGDALVFQLIGRTTFKVCIIRVNGSEEGNKL